MNSPYALATLSGAILAACAATCVMMFGTQQVWHLHGYELSGQYGFSFMFGVVPLALLLALVVSLSIATMSNVKNWEPRRSVKWLTYSLIVSTILFIAGMELMMVIPN